MFMTEQDQCASCGLMIKNENHLTVLMCNSLLDKQHKNAYATIPICTMLCPEDCTASCNANLSREMFVPFGRTYGAPYSQRTLDKAHFAIVLLDIDSNHNLILSSDYCLILAAYHNVTATCSPVHAAFKSTSTTHANMAFLTIFFLGVATPSPKFTAVTLDS